LLAIFFFFLLADWMHAFMPIEQTQKIPTWIVRVRNVAALAVADSRP
jgi:hypothetical protein